MIQIWVQVLPIVLVSFIGSMCCAVEISPKLPLEETEKYIADINPRVLDDLTSVANLQGSGYITSCKDMILKNPPMPNDPDVNLIYLNTYTWCMMQAVLRTFLETHQNDFNNSQGKQEILDALSVLSSFLPSLLLSYNHAISCFGSGLRDKLMKERNEMQQLFPEVPQVPSNTL